MSASYLNDIQQGYPSTAEKGIVMGIATHEGQFYPSLPICLPLKTLNRHGLIAGATGTGKTISLQVLAEGMSTHGIPVLMMDLKGDLSGIAAPGTENSKTIERCKETGIPFKSAQFPVEILSLSAQDGVRLRATVSEFGPVLLSKILELNATQASVLAILFKYADDKRLPLVDLQDLKTLIQHVTGPAKEEIKAQYGNISSTTSSIIIRKIIELETQGAELFFGEKSFETNDLVRVHPNGKGYISIVRLNDMQDKPKLFSTFMLQLLAEIYSSFPEAGDVDKPKLCIFIDEAHLIFKDAEKIVLDQIESIIKLIRSKGVGIYFCTQNPEDIAEGVLAQLGLKIQHALRAFTEKDRKAIRKTAENYPESKYYKTQDILTSIGIGQAIITGLNEKGIPSPLVVCHVRAPYSRIGVLQPEELKSLIQHSEIYDKYNRAYDPQSAHDILSGKLQAAAGDDTTEEEIKEKQVAPEEESGFFDKLSKNPIAREVGRTLAREITRGLLGVLGLGGRSGRSKRSLF